MPRTSATSISLIARRRALDYRDTVVPHLERLLEATIRSADVARGHEEVRMRRLAVSLAVGAAFLALAAPASAGALYAGGGFDYATIDYPGLNDLNLPQHTTGPAFHLGYRLDRHVAIEGGYFSLDGSSGHEQIGLEGATIDALVYEPMFRGLFEPFLTFGGSWTSGFAHHMVSMTASDGAITMIDTPYWSHEALNWRAGFGLESQVTNHLSLRVGARYEGGGFANHLHGRMTIGFGVNLFL